MVYHLFVGEEHEGTQVSAHSKTNGAAYIGASSLQACIDALPEAQDLLADALQSWEPKEEKEEARQDPKQARQERMQEFESSTRGKRFLRGIELSKGFLGKKHGSGLFADEVFYLMDRTAETGQVVSTIFDVYCLAFRKGYQIAQKNAKHSGKGGA